VPQACAVRKPEAFDFLPLVQIRQVAHRLRSLQRPACRRQGADVESRGLTHLELQPTPQPSDQPRRGATNLAQGGSPGVSHAKISISYSDVRPEAAPLRFVDIIEVESMIRLAFVRAFEILEHLHTLPTCLQDFVIYAPVDTVNMRRLRYLPIIFLIMFWFAENCVAQQQCPSAPALAASSGPNIFQPQQETDLGELMAEQMDSRYKVINGPELTAYLEKIAARLAEHLPQTGLRFRLFIIDTPVIDSFSTPGGRIY
jgi:hypothetical protein